MMDTVSNQLKEEDAKRILQLIEDIVAFTNDKIDILSHNGISTDWINNVEESDLNYMRQDLWDFINIKHIPLTDIGLSKECADAIIALLYDDYDNVDVFCMVHFPEEYFDYLPDKFKIEIAKCAKAHNLFNPYVRGTFIIENFYECCEPYL